MIERVDLFNQDQDYSQQPRPTGLEELRAQAYAEVRPELEATLQGVPEAERERILAEIGQPYTPPPAPRRSAVHVEIDRHSLALPDVKTARDLEAERLESWRRNVERVQRESQAALNKRGGHTVE